jgi:hypothetical protein
MDREQLHGSDPEIPEVVGAGGMRETRIGAADLFRNIRVQLREAFDVEFADRGLGHRDLRRRVSFPVILRKGRDGCPGGVKAAVGETGGSIGAHSFHGRIVAGRLHDVSRIRIEEELRLVEVVARFRFPGALRAESVGRPGWDPSDPTETDIPILAGKLEAMGFSIRVFRVREQAEKDRVGVLGNDGKIHRAVLVSRCSERKV